ncbi:MAG: hypothetical protein IH597_15415 [Bacteroidales bacterium]|nr:hypothetical protein [Bacteroidales bacterium]
MKPFFNILIIIATFALLLTSSCKKDDNTPSGKYSKGILISNEGPFTDGSGTISFYDPAAKTIENNIFANVNSRPLGNIVQSLEIFNERAYIVVNNAGKVEVADAASFESIGVIEGLTSPRYFVGINNTKGYVSDWAGHIAITDLSTLTKTGTIVTGASPDRMLLHENHLWVINSAGWTSDSTVTIIDTQTDTPLQTIVVGDNPSGIVKDANGKIWVLCGGISDWMNPANNTNGSLVRINPDSYAVELSLEIAGSDFGPRIAINGPGNKIYFSFLGSIYPHEIDAVTINSNPLISKLCYALDVDPHSGEIYFCDPLDYAQPGVIYRYDANGATMLDSLKAGIIPGNFVFQN